MMGHHEKLKSGEEYDCFTGWRKALRFRAGRRKQAKRRFWKRIRKDYKLDFKENGHETTR